VSAVEKAGDTIDAFVSQGGDGGLITVMMMPDQRSWRFLDINPATAREFAERLLSAANAAERNAESATAQQ
jgi:hypothetical protein